MLANTSATIMAESEEHSALAELFRHHPGLAVRLVLRSGRATLPANTTTRSAHPVFRTKHEADALSLVHDADDLVILAVPVEIQRGIDEEKDFTWPVYGWTARALQRCASRVLILAMTTAVASWARSLIVDQPDDRVQFIVLGPDDIPRITDLAAARADPSLAVLSAAFHGAAPGGAAVMRAAAAAMVRLPRAQALKYSRIVFHQLTPPAIRALVKDIMQTQQAPQEEYGAGWKAFVRELKAEGAARGAARAELKTRALILLRQLDQRGLAVDAATRKRVLTCKDIDQLDRWLDRVLTVRHTADLFKDRPGAR